MLVKRDFLRNSLVSISSVTTKIEHTTCSVGRRDSCDKYHARTVITISDKKSLENFGTKHTCYGSPKSMYM